MSFGIIRPMQSMGPRPVVNRDREYPRIPTIPGSSITVAVLGEETTNGSGAVTFDFTPPPGDKLTVYVTAPTQTSGTLVCPGFGTAPGSPAGAFLPLPLPGGTSTLTVYSYSSGGTPVSGRTLGLQGFAV